MLHWMGNKLLQQSMTNMITAEIFGVQIKQAVTSAARHSLTLQLLPSLNTSLITLQVFC